MLLSEINKSENATYCSIPTEKAMAPTPVLLPGKSPWKEEPGWLQSMGSLRVGQD